MQQVLASPLSWSVPIGVGCRNRQALHRCVVACFIRCVVVEIPKLFITALLSAHLILSWSYYLDFLYLITLVVPQHLMTSQVARASIYGEGTQMVNGLPLLSDPASNSFTAACLHVQTLCHWPITDPSYWSVKQSQQ